MTVLERYHALSTVTLPQGDFYLKQGVRGFPETPPAGQVFPGAVAEDQGALVDATGTAGMAALAAVARARSAALSVLEPSMAALRCARATLSSWDVPVVAGLPWDLADGTVRRLALAPPADRGNARVLAEITAAARALTPGGLLYLALHKDQGAKRYQKLAARLFTETVVKTRERGWRLVVAREPLPAAGGPADGAADGWGSAPSYSKPSWQRFDAAGLELEALPGVHSVGRLDPGTAVLLHEVPWSSLAGCRVLDLGCGVGVLGLLAARSGAEVMALDDDLAAVRSASRNAERLGLNMDVRHSDIDSAVAGERFEVVLCNPPFHVGKGVRLALPEAFIEGARQLLVSGGELWLVANRDLPYERSMGAWASVGRQADRSGFKVLRASR